MYKEGERKFELRRLILCEGIEDITFVSALIQKYNLPVYHTEHTGRKRNDRGGNSRFGEKLSSLKFNRHFKNINRILIITDSDGDPDKSFEVVRNQITNAGFTAPTKPLEITQSSPRIAIMMIPQNGEGNLEFLCQEAARSVDGTKAGYVDNFVSLIDGDKWPTPAKGKLWLRTMIAASWQKDPCINLAPLFGDPRAGNLIPLNHNSFKWIANFIQDFAS